MAKPSYYIEPVSFNAPEMELMLMVSNENFVFTIRDDKQQPSYNGLWSFDRPANLSTDKALCDVLDENPIFRQSFFKTNIIVCSNKQFFTPTQLANEATNEEIVRLLQPNYTNSDAIVEDNLGEVKSVFLVPSWLQNICNTRLYNINIAHQHSLIFALSKPTKTYLDLYIQNKDIIIKLVFNNIVQTVRKFSYNNADDIVYHLLHACKVYNAESSIVPIYISGFVEKESVLYRSIQKYFKHTYIEGYHQNLNFKTDMFNVTPHFFSKFFEICQCV